MGAPQGLPKYLYTQQQVPKRFIARRGLQVQDRDSTNKSKLISSYERSYQHYYYHYHNYYHHSYHYYYFERDVSSSVARRPKRKAIIYRTYQDGELPDIKIKLSGKLSLVLLLSVLLSLS